MYFMFKFLLGMNIVCIYLIYLICFALCDLSSAAGVEFVKEALVNLSFFDVRFSREKKKRKLISTFTIRGTTVSCEVLLTVVCLVGPVGHWCCPDLSSAA